MLPKKLIKLLISPKEKKPTCRILSGLILRDDQKRSYPYQTLAAQVVGFANADDDGMAGIEQSQDDILHGAIIRKVQERDRLGRIYDETIAERDTPSDIVLTIDSAYQFMVEQALEKGVKAANARSGVAIVMSPKTGEILALANYPTFDPNSVGSANVENFSNKAIQSVYSPGSVFKVVTYSSALEKHLFSAHRQNRRRQRFYRSGETCIFRSPYGRNDLFRCPCPLSNICAIKTGMAVGREDFFAMLKKMGFGSKTGVELPAETSGIVRSPQTWGGVSLASMSIGYEIGVTALQMTGPFATIANNGIKVQPHIIKEIRHSDDKPKTVTETQQTQVVSAETARNLRAMLKQVVLTGTGRRAQLDGYTVAGKTGTAWKFNPKTKSVDSSKYVSSFIGMAPAHDPR